MRLNSIMLLSSFCLALNACGQAIPTSGGGGSNAPESFQSQMGGSWEGPMTNKTVDTGSALHNQTATVEFDFTSDDEGKFTISLPNVDKATAKGTFRDFAGKSLHLKIEESTISTVGVKGATTRLNYMLIGSNLELSNDNIDLQLIKTKAGGKGSKHELEQPSEGLMGQWRCTDSMTNVWSFNIRDNTAFSADIQAQNGAAVWISGKLETDERNQGLAIATVTGSADNNNVGMRLKMRLNTANQLLIERYKSKDPAVVAIADSFYCSRQ